MNSVKTNIAANYAGQLYLAFVGILVMPAYLGVFGAEAFGLVGFYTLLQSWMQLFDLGISPTLGREIALKKNKREFSFQLRSVVRSLESIFFGIGLVAASSLFLVREWIATNWLGLRELSIEDVSLCLAIVSVVIGFRWISALHKSGINAYEKQVWTSAIDILFATLRYPGSLVVVYFFSNSVVTYFIYQAILALVEQIVLSMQFYRLLPTVSQPVPWISVSELKSIAPFALGVAYTSGIWVLTSQLDKLLLSKFLSLSDYGYFTLVATVSGGISILSGPVGKAILPRMTNVFSQGQEAEMLRIYRKGTRLVLLAVVPFTALIAGFPSQVVYVWTGDRAAAMWAENVLPLFILGNALITLIAFQYYLQYVKGVLKMHIAYNTFSALIGIPLIYYAAANYGVVMVGYVWLCLRIITFLFWTPYVHKIFAPGLHIKWLMCDVSPTLLVAAIFHVFVVSFVSAEPLEHRVSGVVFCAGYLISLGLIVYFSGRAKLLRIV